MPTYEHVCTCGHEWEDFYSITKDPPTICPKCEKEGGVKRLISGGYGRGIVILSGHDLASHLHHEGQKLKHKSKTDENLMANLVGEEKYHDQMLNRSKLETELVKIGQDAPTTTQRKEINKKKGVIRRVDNK